MGSGTSGLYSGTAGSGGAAAGPSAAAALPAKASKTAMQISAKSWAKTIADELAAESERKRSKFNTASVVYDEESGRYSHGRNKGIELSGAKKNPQLFGKNGVLPKETLNIYPLGNCAEVDAINNALNSGAKLENLTLMTVHAHEGKFGEPKIACENCTYAFKGKIKHNHSRWKEDQQ